LLDSPGKPASIDSLANRLELRGREVSEAVKYFVESGIDLQGGDESCRLNDLPDSILPAVILCGLQTRVLRGPIHSFKTLGSTNVLAKRLAETGGGQGTLVIADRQTRGRGRLGRSWHSPPGVGLYFSIVLRPQTQIARMPALSQVAGLSICHVLEREHGLSVQLKWPNDCVLNGKKIAGILVELSAEMDKINYAILGIGLNVNHKREDFPAGLRSRATSLLLETKSLGHRIKLLQGILADFERSYAKFQRYGLQSIGPELVRRSAVLGKRVTVNLGKKKIAGVAIGIDENGALRLKLKDRVKTISAGEVSLR
jgi:BirA family biotin operon repressor/biotin-[acetyl-CoA-carboxylase] ligase